MTPFERFVQFLAAIILGPWVFIKLLFLLGFLIYVAFAVIVVRQVDLMHQTLNGVLDFPLKLIAWIHLGVAVAIFLLALVIL